ncbi:MAG: oligosaccharide flippase family protein [Actinomycetota bacterium]|nr:oligosaccharide flippase family protein [Actinomycetota bacterium]
MDQPRSALAKGLVFVGIATLVGNGAAYGLSMFAARILDPAQFGAFGALMGVLIIVSTFAIALQTLTARRVAVAGADRAEVEGQSVRLAFYIASVILVVGIFAAWPIGEVLAIPYTAMVLGLASLAFVVLGTASLGIAQGREEHLRFSSGFIVNGMGRAFGGIAFLLIFGSLEAAALGILLGCALGAFISYRIICPGTWGSSISRGSLPEFGHVAHALVVLFTLTNVDVLLARVFLTESESGEYSVGVLLAKIAFFLPNAIIIVLFPKMTSGDNRRAVFIATGLTAILGACITLFSFLFGSFVIRVLGGAQYIDLGLGESAWRFALEGSAFALVQVLLYARLAAQDRRAVLLVWAGLVVLVLSVSLWFHSSVEQIVTTVVVVSLVLTAVGLLLDRRSSPRGTALVPIEAAE